MVPGLLKQGHGHTHIALDHTDFVGRKHRLDHRSNECSGCRRHFTRLEAHRVAGADCVHQRNQTQIHRKVPRRHNEGNPFGLVVDFSPPRNQCQRQRQAVGARPAAQVGEHVVNRILDRKQLIEVAFDFWSIEVRSHGSVKFASAANEFRSQCLESVAAVAQWERGNAGGGGLEGLKFGGERWRHTPKVTRRDAAQFATMPSRRRMMRFARCAISSSWVTTTSVLPAW